MRGRFELGHCDQLFFQAVDHDDAVFDEDVRIAFDQPIELLMRVQVPNDDVVDDQQRGGADQAAGDAVVFADDRVLYRVRQREQYDQVERVELRQFALAGEPQADDQEHVNHDGPQDFFGDRQPEDKHVGKQLRVHDVHANG